MCVREMHCRSKWGGDISSPRWRLIFRLSVWLSLCNCLVWKMSRWASLFFWTLWFPRQLDSWFWLISFLHLPQWAPSIATPSTKELLSLPTWPSSLCLACNTTKKQCDSVQGPRRTTIKNERLFFWSVSILTVIAGIISSRLYQKGKLMLVFHVGTCRICVQTVWAVEHMKDRNYSHLLVSGQRLSFWYRASRKCDSFDLALFYSKKTYF